MNRKVFKVSEINRYIKSLLEEDVILQNLFIEGEISNFKHHSSGHMYFTLKDKYAAIQCVMFKTYAMELAFEPENGMKVVAWGRASLYEKTGQYQLYLEYLEPAGKGALYLAFEQIKERLLKEGLFDASRKKEIPAYPKTIAIITSPTGAAIWDLISVSQRRNPLVKLALWPVLVQGPMAAGEIADTIDKVNAWGKADVIIVGRGGGSLEDLWAFNEEKVARAIYHSKTPVISAVGHETDFTIADFVADRRAPTPSAAAEIAVPELAKMTGDLLDINKRLNRLIKDNLARNREMLLRLSSKRVMQRPLELVYQRQIYLTGLQKQIDTEINNRLEKNKLLINGLSRALESVSPLHILEKGYALIYDEGGSLIKKAKGLCKGQEITVRFHDGAIKSEVKESV